MEPTDHHQAQRPQRLYASPSVTESASVIPGEGAILAPIWHLLGTDLIG
jgi:hypothetical protein